MKKFSKKEIIKDIIEYLENSKCFYGCELHNEVFNVNYYIIGTYKAREALENYGVFKAIEEVQTYEKENFGEIYTDLSDPEQLANMLYYVKLDEYLNYLQGEILEILDENWNNELTEDEVKKLTELFKKELLNYKKD